MILLLIYSIGFYATLFLAGYFEVDLDDNPFIYAVWPIVLGIVVYSFGMQTKRNKADKRDKRKA